MWGVRWGVGAAPKSSLPAPERGGSVARGRGVGSGACFRFIGSGPIAHVDPTFGAIISRGRHRGVGDTEGPRHCYLRVGLIRVVVGQDREKVSTCPRSDFIFRLETG